MTRKSKPITCRLFIPDGNGYREWDGLTDAEKEAFGKQCTNRMGEALNDYFDQHIDIYRIF
ncbi:MAG: hypothetical protein IKO83_04930 [Oscillospiraceae bacterium]|nr:hypothetical protein [Oscillospiraceae bacterium]